MIVDTLATFFEQSGSVASWLSWAGIGIVLLTLDMLFPGIFLLFLGIASLITMSVLFFIPLSLWGAVGCFCIATLLLLMCFGRIYKNWIHEGQSHDINQRGKNFEGQEIILTHPIIRGHGRASYAGSMWTLRGDDAPSGSAVRIVKLDGNVLHVERVDKI